ncbi:hypothetical protein BGX26_006837 [Mortierella sp. AD094]|nr:hypothetical protein BGX26_006837 [Mortierella sp. AD094]
MLQNWDLPNEIYFQIGFYLNRHQLINSALVCKSWNATFGSQVWEHLQLGSDKPIIQLSVQDLLNKASCTRILDFTDCESIIRFSPIGKGCTQLRALSIATTPGKASHRKEYWRAYEELIREIPRTLESLTLRHTPIPGLKFKNGSFNWTPLLNIVQYPHSNLRTLRLEHCVLPLYYIDSFWDVCERVQVLELLDVPFELPRKSKIRRRTKGTPHQPRIIQFSNLLELTLNHSGPKDLLTQLEMIIREAPKLRKLCWKAHRRQEAKFPVSRFMYLFSGQAKYHLTTVQEDRSIPLKLCTAPCWPDLESLRLNGTYGTFSDREYLDIVETFKNLRVLSVPVYPVSSTIVNSLVRLHSGTLTEIDWDRFHSYEQVAWVQQILSSCPMLTKGYFRCMRAQDIIDGGGSWVCCDRLEELRVDIIMGEPTHQLPRADAIDQEWQDMSWAVFKQLARLHRLRVLDMYYYGIRTLPLQFTKAMGLSQLSSLTELEVLRLQGGQDLSPQDVAWMIENWKSLKTVDATRLAQNRTRFAEKNFWDCALATMFNDHGIKTPRSIFTSYTAGKRFNYEELDWSFYPQANCQTEANPQELMDVDIF